MELIFPHLCPHYSPQNYLVSLKIDMDVSDELERESNWTVGERSGTCTIDLDMQVDVTVSDDLTGETDSVLVTGRACEHDLSFNAVLPITPEM